MSLEHQPTHFMRGTAAETWGTDTHEVMRTTSADWDTEDMTTTAADCWDFDDQMESRFLISLICYFCLAISQRRKLNINTMKAATLLIL